MSKQTQETPAGIDAFLRSINVQLDAADPGRIAHFRPTAKATLLLETLFMAASNAVLVTAPYGSGKSLTATYALNLVENRDDAKPVLKQIGDRLTDVAAEVGSYAKKRCRSGKQGATIALQGHVGSISQALCDGYFNSVDRQGTTRGLRAKLNRHLESDVGSVVETMRFLQRLAKDGGFDEILVIWDEFGRHLESLIAQGRPSELHDVQQLAELAVRSRGLPFRFCVLLHQGVQVYASAAPETVRREWKKIEERFQRVDYVDDSKEIIKLLGDLVVRQSGRCTSPPSKTAVTNYARSLIQLGLFKEFKIRELADLLLAVHPLDGVALFLLPRVSARVAQNERTLFNFLQSAAWDRRVDASSIYRFFEVAMRQDVGPGGTYRAMLETSSASSKCSSELEVDILQAACVLSIGLSGNRTKISRDLLLAVVVGAGGDRKACEDAIDALIERKLLLYRRHSDEVSVWHGTDVNLREKVAEAKRTAEPSFNLVEFLESEWPLPAVRASQHNDRFRIRRYFERMYRLPDSLSYDEFSHGLGGEDSAGDGVILHTLPVGDTEARDAVFAAAKSLSKKSRGRIIISVPLTSIPLEQAALELAAILRLQRDRNLLDEDPLVAEELRQLEDDARSHLQKLLDRIVSPSPEQELEFVVEGRRMDVGSFSALRSLVSSICDKAFPQTPKLPNEQVNRRKPSAVIVNARKKLLAAVLEFTGRPDFGFHDPAAQKELGSAAVAQYRSIIRNPGLYREMGVDRWGFSSPTAIEDEGLAGVWEEIRVFLTEPEADAKPVSRLFDALRSEPYGLRAGVLPILMACAVRAFPVAGALIQDGRYVGDIRPTTIEEMCREPRRFTLKVAEISEGEREYLDGVCRLFRGKKVSAIDDPDLIRRAYEWIQVWKSESPDCLRVGSGLSSSTGAVRQALWSQGDPLNVLLAEIPAAVGGTQGSWKTVLKKVREAKTEIESLVEQYVTRAWHVMAAAAGVEITGSSDDDLSRGLRTWAESLPEAALDRSPDPRLKGVVSQLLAGEDAERTAVAVTARLTKSVHRWDDGEVSRFGKEFGKIVEAAEEAAIDCLESAAVSDKTQQQRLAAMVERRLRRHVETLARIVGVKSAEQRLKGLLPASPKSRRQLETVENLYGDS